MDDFDKSILQILNQDGRIAFSSIAAQLQISNTMVHQRINKLMEKGIIKGIRPDLDERKMGYDWAAFTGLVLDKDHESGRIIQALKEIPEITECYYITGAYALYIRILAKSHQHMRELLYDKIDNIPGIIKTESMMELGCAFRRNVIE